MIINLPLIIFFKIWIAIFCIPFTNKPGTTMIGQTINNYILERKLGEGGMGEVFFARHNRIERVVAIKILHKNLFTNEIIRSRFKNEANALIKLGHPNIVKIYDYVEQEGVACLIMEYIDGVTLDDFINKISGPLPASKAIQIISNVLDAVQYAHDNHVIHRDIKPGNIMVSRDGNSVRVMDFGIAKFADSSALGITHANVQLGTPFYMSPEQVKGIAYSAPSDIYSLGVTFFEMVTGKCPYLEITNLFELQSKIVNEPLPPTDKYYPNVPPKFQEAIKIATNKDPELRFKSCNEFNAFIQPTEKLRAEPMFNKTQIQLQPQLINQPLTKSETVRNLQYKSQQGIEEKKKRNSWVYWMIFLALAVSGVLIYSFLNKSTDTSTGTQTLSEIDTKSADSAKSQTKDTVTLNPALTNKLINSSDSAKKDSLNANVSDPNKKIEISDPLPAPPSSQKIIKDLIGKKLSNGLIFSEKGIKRGPIFMRNGNYATLDYMNENGDTLYRIVTSYTLSPTGYVYIGNNCRVISVNKNELQKTDDNSIPAQPDNARVKADLIKNLKGGGNKGFGINYDDIDQITNVNIGKGECFTNCFTIAYKLEFIIRDKMFKCLLTYSQKGNEYRLYEAKLF